MFERYLLSIAQVKSSNGDEEAVDKIVMLTIPSSDDESGGGNNSGFD